MKNNKQTKNLLCIQMQIEDVAALHMRADRLHVDADKYKERRRKEKLTCGDLNSLHADADGRGGIAGGYR